MLTDETMPASPIPIVVPRPSSSFRRTLQGNASRRACSRTGFVFRIRRFAERACPQKSGNGGPRFPAGPGREVMTSQATTPQAGFPATRPEAPSTRDAVSLRACGRLDGGKAPGIGGPVRTGRSDSGRLRARGCRRRPPRSQPRPAATRHRRDRTSRPARSAPTSARSPSSKPLPQPRSPC